MEDIRKHDQQRLDALRLCRKELRILRSRLPIPEGARAEQAVDPTSREQGYWNVSVGQVSTMLIATDRDSALRAGVNLLSWLPALPQE